MLKFYEYKNITKFLVIIVFSFIFFLTFEFLFPKELIFEYIEILLFCSIAILITSFLFASQKQYYKHFLFLFLSFLSILYIVNDNVQYMISFYTGVTNFLLLLLCYFNRRCKSLSFIITIIVLFPTLFIWQYFFISKNFLNVYTILTIYQTNFSEAKSYITSHMEIKQIFGLIVLLIWLFVAVKYNSRLKVNYFNNIKMYLIISICLNFFVIKKGIDNVIINILIETKENIYQFYEFKELISKKKEHVIDFEQSQNINKGVYVLVLGESQNKMHMSAYGYNKKTTPWLDSMGNNKNFIKFENCYSCHVHTVQTLSYALTSKNQYNDICLSKAMSILDALKVLNFQIVWVSNQHRFGYDDTPVSAIANTAQQQKWLCEKNFCPSYDYYIIEELKKINLSDNMLIIIHLIGNHFSYEDRYPKSFIIFGEDTDIACYDNSILYNDYIMKNIFETVKLLPNFQALIYCADHAEAVDEGLEHDSTQFVPSMTYVPMYIYLSDSYIKDNSQIYMNLRNHKNYYFTNDLLFNLLLGVLKVKITDVYEQDNDITNEKYNNDINRFRTLYGNKTIFDIENNPKNL